MNTKAMFFERSYIAQLLGPLFLLPVFLFAGRFHPHLNYDLLAIGSIGLLISATRQTRGCAYVLALLVLSAICKHAWIDSHHFFQACLECSVAFSCLLTSLIFTEVTDASTTLHEQMTRKAETIQFLEEDFGKEKERLTQDIASMNNQLLERQSAIDATQSDFSALQILNEVLRKTTAKAIEEGAKSVSELKVAESRLSLLQSEFDALQTECHKLSNHNLLAEQNDTLFKELNIARFKAEQTNLINETLARLLASQADKIQELKAVEMDVVEKDREIEKLSASVQEIEALRTANQADKIQELKALEAHLLEKEREIENLRVSVQEIEALRTANQADKIQELKALESSLLEKEREIEKLSASVQEIEALRTANQALQERTFSPRNDEYTSKLIEKLTRAEALHRQLQEQFVQKNKILEQTRRELFQADTEKQRLEQVALERDLHMDPLPVDLRAAWELLDEENAQLAAENEHLTEIVTHLTLEKKK